MCDVVTETAWVGRHRVSTQECTGGFKWPTENSKEWQSAAEIPAWQCTASCRWRTTTVRHARVVVFCLWQYLHTNVVTFCVNAISKFEGCQAVMQMLSVYHRPFLACVVLIVVSRYLCHIDTKNVCIIHKFFCRCFLCSQMTIRQQFSYFGLC